MTFREYVKDCVVPQYVLDTFLNLDEPNWATFDTHLGYRLRTNVMRDGVDGCITINHFEPLSCRRTIQYAGKPCRINTYGDSFTQCHQVSDGETWQEYLAAHIGEPIRNFGVGGYGVYQAYLRLLTHESDPETHAEYIVLNIFDDDHARNIDKWRWMRIHDFRKGISFNPYFFHANPWDHVEMDLTTGKMTEVRSICPTKESLYNLCCEEFIYEQFKDDFAANCEQAKRGFEYNKAVLERYADALDSKLDFSPSANIIAQLYRLHDQYAMRASEFVVDLVSAFARDHGRKLLLMQSYGSGNIANAMNGRERFDKDFCAYIKSREIPCFDLYDSHARDAKRFCVPEEEYLRTYYIEGAGHYNPTGNHFCAFGFKNLLINELEPKPLTYSGEKISAAAQAALLA